ncbi:glycohydrolase toxin TNT-related protein, partial [Elizabethkingia miricola]
EEDFTITPSSVKSGFYKNADDFATSYDSEEKVSQAIRVQASDLYKQRNWKELEKLFQTNNLNNGWPPANGGYNIIDDVAIEKGQKYDRYSGAVGSYNGTGIPTLGGNFTSPIINGYVYTFTERALNRPENKYDFYYEIEVLNSLPFTSQTADIIPWFNQTGNGKQAMWKIPLDRATGFPKTWNKLAEEGYIKITIKKSPSGKYNNLVGTVIQ